MNKKKYMSIKLKSFSSLVFLFMILMSGFSVTAQKKEIKGKVVDETNGQPLEGVNIIIEKSKSGAATKKDGTFSIAPKSAKATLIFSMIGYATQIVKLDKAIDTLRIQMKPSYTDNAEVVVVGYGTQRRSDVTGAISKYKNDRLDEAPVSRLDQALQGKIAGLQIQNISSEAGADPRINIRGVSSIYAGAEPLVVLDGQPVPDGLSFVNMADVESVEIFKDAASAAIYGSRGASGVILITTKSGKADKVKYTFKYSLGTKQPYKLYDVMTTSEYVNRLFYEYQLKLDDPLETIIPSSPATDNERAGYVIENRLLNGRGVNWQSQGLRTGLFRNIQLSATGGKADFKYYLSGGYQKEQGIMRNSQFDKLNFMSKLDFSLSKKVKCIVLIMPSYTHRVSPSVNYTTFMRYPSFMPVYHNDSTINLIVNNTYFPHNTQWDYLQIGDYAQPRHFNNLDYYGTMPDGSFWNNSGADPFSSSTNSPTSILRNTAIFTKDYRLQTSIDLTYKIRKGLDFKSQLSGYFNYTYGLNWSNRNAEQDGTVSKGIFTNNTARNLLAEQTLNYTKTIKDHSFVGLLGFTTQTTITEKNQVTGLDFPDNSTRTLNNATLIDKSGTTSTLVNVGLISYLGRINYSYQGKYLLTTSFRTDGSSYFGPGKKWGTFPSVSLGWLMDKEKFMRGNKVISQCKWRASYGVSGNNRILDFGFLELLYPANYAFGSGTGMNTNGQATSPTIRSNSDLTWERTFQANFGLDLSLWRNKVSLTADFYRSKTDRLLLQQSAMAFTGVPLSWNNIGRLQNTGIELQLQATLLTTSSLKWTASANFSHNRNKILELGNEAYLQYEGERNELYRNIVGGPLIQFYGFKTDGIWISQQEIAASGLTSNFRDAFNEGQLKIVDMNGDGIIDNNDRTILGSPYPDFNWGVTQNISVGSFEFSMTIQGSQGGKVINGDPNYDEVKKLIRSYNDNRWISPGNPGDGRTPTYSKSGFNWMLTDYVLEDASYYTIREVSLSYRLNAAKMEKMNLNGLRFYITAQNLYYHMANGYRGINPEARLSAGPYASSLVGGYQRGGFPVPRSFVFGIDLNF
jgi:TonB-linked SusC/RagA family outer membrane protein